MKFHSNFWNSDIKINYFKKPCWQNSSSTVLWLLVCKWFMRDVGLVWGVVIGCWFCAYYDGWVLANGPCVFLSAMKNPKPQIDINKLQCFKFLRWYWSEIVIEWWRCRIKMVHVNCWKVAYIIINKIEFMDHKSLRKALPVIWHCGYFLWKPSYFEFFKSHTHYVFQRPARK